MSIQCGRWIRELAAKHRMIEPFSKCQVRDGVINHGVFPVVEAFASAAGSRFFHQCEQRHHRSKGL